MAKVKRVTMYTWHGWPMPHEKVKVELHGARKWMMRWDLFMQPSRSDLWGEISGGMGGKVLSFSNAVSLCKFSVYLFQIHHTVKGNLLSVPSDPITKKTVFDWYRQGCSKNVSHILLMFFLCVQELLCLLKLFAPPPSDSWLWSVKKACPSLFLSYLT